MIPQSDLRYRKQVARRLQGITCKECIAHHEFREGGYCKLIIKVFPEINNFVDGDEPTCPWFVSRENPEND